MSLYSSCLLVMSVLSAIRACVVSGNRARVDGDVVHLSPGVSLPRKSSSAWRYRKDDYLTLDSIVFFLDNDRLKLSEYVKACNAAAVQVIPFGERKALLEFVRGEKDSNTYIDQDRESQQQQQRQPHSQPPHSTQPALRADGMGSSLTQQLSSATAGSALRDSTTSLPASTRKRAYDAVEEDGLGASGGQEPSPVSSALSSQPHSSSSSASAALTLHSNLPADPSTLPASLRPPSSWQLSECVAEERVYLTRVSCLQSANDFSAVLQAWDEAQSHRAYRERHAESEEQRQRKSAKTSHRQSSSSAASSSSTRPGGGGSGSGSRPSSSHHSALFAPSAPSSSGGIPIILVPSSLSSCLTLYNARDFLESGHLIPTSEKRAAMAALAKPAFIRLQRPSCLDKQRVVYFDVMDDVTQLRSSDDWRRVVAVFVSGSAWQFDGWPAPFTSPAAIAAHIAAFYMHYSDEPVNKNVQQWRVHRLTAHRDKHHHDRSLQLDFWNTLTEQLKCNNKATKLSI